METTVASVVLTGEDSKVVYDPVRVAYAWNDGDTTYTAATLAEAHTIMLYNDIRSAVLGSLRGRNLNPTDAEDACQEGFTAVWLAFNHEIAKGEAHTRSWYKTRAVRYAKTWLRDNVYRYNRERESEFMSGMADVAQGGNYQGLDGTPGQRLSGIVTDQLANYADDPWDQIESQIAVQELANMVRKSGSPRRALIIIALAFAGKKIDAAKLLGISGPAISDHLPDIREAVRQFLLS